MTRLLFPALFAFALLAGCGSDTVPEPAASSEVIVLTHIPSATPPLAEALAAAGGGTVERSGGIQHVRLSGARPLAIAIYPDHDAIMARLREEGAPEAALFVVGAADGPFSDRHGPQARLAQEKGVPVVAALMADIHRVDDLELIDLVEMEVSDMLDEAGYAGVPVFRASTVEAVEGDADDQAALRELIAALRDAVR